VAFHGLAGALKLAVDHRQSRKRLDSEMNHEPFPDRAYVPAVDGLRFFAVAGVIWFHMDMLGIPSRAGWIGVWLFFVISGFVITSSIGGPAYAQRSYWAKLQVFWTRRAFRILPLYFLFVALGVLVITALPNYHRFLAHVPYLMSFTYNFYRMSPDYENTHLFGHFWSLSVEEQFYLLFPLVYFASTPLVQQYILIGVIAVSPLVRWLCSLIVSAIFEETPAAGNAAGNAVYLFSPGHFDAFAVGALIALNRTRIEAWKYSFQAAAFVVLALIALYVVACVVLVPERKPLSAIVAGFDINVYRPFQHVALYTVLNCTFGATIIGVLSGYRPLVAILEITWFRYLGRISYGMYVVHLPLLLVFYRMELPKPIHISEPLGVALYLGTLIVACHLLYQYFERPFLALRPRWASA
jgi:peptidoglycan/LPS O-acetylase OafA/YrhL